MDKFNRAILSQRDTELNTEETNTEFTVGLGQAYKNITNRHNKSDGELSKRIGEIEKIGKTYKVTNTYFSTKGKRFIEVGKAIDNNDVIIKQQFDEAFNRLEKKLKDHIDKFNQFKASK